MQSQERKESVQKRLFRLAGEIPGYLRSLALLSALLTAIIIFQMYLLSVVVNDVFMLHKAPGNHMLYLLAGAFVARALLVWVRERKAQQNTVRIRSALRCKLFGHLLNQGPHFSQREKTGELVNLLTEGDEKLDDYFTKYIPSIIHIGVLSVVVIVFVFFYDWLSGLILFLTAPLILFFMWLIGTWAGKLTSLQWNKMSAMSSHFLDALQGIKTLKIFNRNRAEAKAVSDTSDGFRAITMKVLRVAFLSGMVLELAASISIAMVALQVGIRLIEGMMGYQAGLFILLLTPEFYLPFRSLGQHHHSGMEGAAAAKKMFQILDTMHRQPNPVAGCKLPEKNIRMDVKHVDFYYPDAAHPALRKVNCSVEPGKLTAIAGHTGSGKTTFSYLLLGFLQPGTGQILINGIPMEDIPEKERNRIIAYVPQHPHFFNMSVFENLRLANTQANLDQVKEACIKAGAHHFITSLPQGYHTQLNENAARLSGGEKQRLAIARAFLKDAPVLIMDEPSSHLDPESEELMASATAELIKERTTLIIAHRLKTIYRANKIMVFDKGQIAETGNHESLIAKKGIYARFVQQPGEGGEV
ncbi:MAG: thiol reductant ABC exporter subunit CydD [Bacteroidetes bacterium]|jgi:ATP-binding cassette subfamily C protein CydD|nr:thiol reductant ABC exporter subunit CydD [Bacteroidota bacterium]